MAGLNWRTSRGKTTVGQIAASPRGCGADRNDAPERTFIRRWNLTGKGLEGLAEAHSALPLVLDELGSSTIGDIRPLIYQLAGGQGKTALSSARDMKEPRRWRTIAIVRLYPAGATLGVTEGIETALVIRQRTAMPVWAGISATLLQRFVPPPRVELVVIWADLDRSGTGEQAALALRERMTDDRHDNA